MQRKGPWFLQYLNFKYQVDTVRALFTVIFNNTVILLCIS